MIRAVLFDLDGLLADSEALSLAAWRELLRRHGYVLEQRMVNQMFGMRVPEAAVLLRGVLGIAASADELAAERDALFLAALPGALQPMPGARAIVAAVRRRGLRTALATSGHRRYVEIALRELGLSAAFDALATGESVAHGKPAPDIFLRAAQLLGIAPAECVVLEDAPNGVAAARAAGALVVAVPNDLTRGLDFAAADAVCPSLAAAEAWIAARLVGEQAR